MKLIFYLFISFCLQKTFAQTLNNEYHLKQNIGITAITGVHFTTLNAQTNILNSILSKKNYPTIYPAFNSVGGSIVFKSNKHCSFMEVAVLHTLPEYTPKDRFVPKFRGIDFRSIFTRKIWNSKKLRLDGGFGVSLNKFHFQLIDRISIKNSLDSILNTPITTSGALDFVQNNYNYNINSRLGITYEAKWFRSILESYEFSFFLDYSQSIINSKNWVTSDSKSKIPDFPTINFSNCYLQFTNTIYFKTK